jgi:hypothetical protein
LSGARVERRLAAILAADVARYSQFTGEDEAGTSHIASAMPASRAIVCDAARKRVLIAASGWQRF